MPMRQGRSWRRMPEILVLALVGVLACSGRMTRSDSGAEAPSADSADAPGSGSSASNPMPASTGGGGAGEVDCGQRGQILSLGYLGIDVVPDRSAAELRGAALQICIDDTCSTTESLPGPRYPRALTEQSFAVGRSARVSCGAGLSGRRVTSTA